MWLNIKSAYPIISQIKTCIKFFIYAISDFVILDTISNASSDQLSGEEDVTEKFEGDLKQWACNNNITHKALNELLRIINSLCPSLPLDARTLLETNRNKLCRNMGNGQFIYFGMKRFFDSNLVVEPCELSCNIDGLPLFKSSQTQFWPIQGSFNGSNPFIIALYCGEEKPNVNLNFSI